MSEDKSHTTEIKEHNTPFIIVPLYSKECNELIFFLPGSSLSEIKFKNYYLSNYGKPRANYKSIHFIINGKELNDEEIQTVSLSDSNNEIFYLYKITKKFLICIIILKLF